MSFRNGARWRAPSSGNSPTSPHRAIDVKEPCGTSRYAGNLFALDSCDWRAFGGYAYGVQAPTVFPAQGVCFADVEPDPEPNPAYTVSAVESLEPLTPGRWGTRWDGSPPEWNEPLPDAMARYNGRHNTQVKPIDSGAHDDYRVAYIDPYLERGNLTDPHQATIGGTWWEWPHASFLAVSAYRAGQQPPTSHYGPEFLEQLLGLPPGP